MSLTVVDPGWASRIVDGGRPRSRSLGVPVGGAADRASWMLGNALVGNAPEAAALEIALKGPILRADAEVAGVVFGAPFTVATARQTLRAGKTFVLAPGEELHIGGTPRGMRGYLCLAGGIEAPTILGSQSALDPLEGGQTLACRPSRLPIRFFGDECPFLVQGLKTQRLRVLPGGQAEWFDLEVWLRQSFTVTPASNRMGLRLHGTPLAMPGRELLSEPVCPGAIQVTRDGQCIILGVDGQTIGGYPKIAHVIHADLDVLGQLQPGNELTFEKISQESAEALNRQRCRSLEDWIVRARASIGG